MNIYKILRPLVFSLESEKAHDLAILFLKYFPNLATLFVLNKEYENLRQNICGLDFLNPIGLSAGFDKNGQCVKAMNRFGFGFVETGTVTPKPQKGNEKPRIFRLFEDEAIINRLGFNNLGSEVFEKNIKHILSAKAFEESQNKILGINIGKNKDSNALEDYLFLLEKFYEKTSYITLNISSPNTENLRDLQGEGNLDSFLKEIMNKKEELSSKTKVKTPIWLKVAPDLDFKDQERISEVVLKYKIDALIVSNTTTSRPQNLINQNKNQQGGLSGKPLFEKSNEVLKNFYKLTNKQIPLIGVGGVSCPRDIYTKIRLGASLVQIYSTLIYNGFSFIEESKKELSEFLEKDGFKNVSEAIGVDVF